MINQGRGWWCSIVGRESSFGSKVNQNLSCLLYLFIQGLSVWDKNKNVESVRTPSDHPESANTAENDHLQLRMIITQTEYHQGR